MSTNFYKEPMDYISENPLRKWRESLQEKYGNPENARCYEYEEWRHGMKTMLVSFQEEIEEQIKKNRENYILDYQKFLQFSEIKRNKENVENKENTKKRKFEN